MKNCNYRDFMIVVEMVDKKIQRGYGQVLRMLNEFYAKKVCHEMEGIGKFSG